MAPESTDQKYDNGNEQQDEKDADSHARLEDVPHNLARGEGNPGQKHDKQAQERWQHHGNLLQVGLQREGQA
jgi:hypothetical protein